MFAISPVIDKHDQTTCFFILSVNMIKSTDIGLGRFGLIGLISFALFLCGCKKTQTLEPTDHLSGETFHTDLRVVGHEFDGLIIENCVFDGGELYLSEVDSVVIRNCTFRNQKKNGIRIGFGGQASRITVEESSFTDIGYNGIDSHEDAPDCIIRNCYFENCALSDIGAAMGQPHHAIYWKGKNVQILNNEFRTGEQRTGNAISHRSSGIISGNIIFNANKFGIMYFADHPGGDSLFIENNFLVKCANGIALATPGNLSYHNKNVHVRFNSLYNADTYSIFVGAEYESTTDVQVYGNVVVQSDGNYLQTSFPVNTFNNLTSTNDIGFVDASNGDLHLKSSSSAIGFCSGLTSYPVSDIDGDSRNSATLDAGADEHI